MEPRLRSEDKLSADLVVPEKCHLLALYTLIDQFTERWGRSATLSLWGSHSRASVDLHTTYVLRRPAIIRGRLQLNESLSIPGPDLRWPLRGLSPKPQLTPQLLLTYTPLVATAL